MPGTARLCLSRFPSAAAGSGGAISLFASDNTDVIIDINGYFIPAGSGTLQFYPVTPCRVADTRNPPYSYLKGGSTTSFSISVACGIPSTIR